MNAREIGAILFLYSPAMLILAYIIKDEIQAYKARKAKKLEDSKEPKESES